MTKETHNRYILTDDEVKSAIAAFFFKKLKENGCNDPFSTQDVRINVHNEDIDVQVEASLTIHSKTIFQ
jgi:hypothetical protein